jgi:microcystin-dependent protein
VADPFIGEIRAVGFNFAPKGWALCDGQLLPINQNQALFSLLGTFYGGDGRTTFALPDLRGRTPVHMGSGPGLTARAVGQAGGAERVTLATSELPKHTHALNASAGAAARTSPKGYVNAVTQRPSYGGLATAPTTMNKQAIGVTGGGSSHENMAPFLTVSYIIALQGIYPSRP